MLLDASDESKSVMPAMTGASRRLVADGQRLAPAAPGRRRLFGTDGIGFTQPLPPGAYTVSSRSALLGRDVREERARSTCEQADLKVRLYKGQAVNRRT